MIATQRRTCIEKIDKDLSCFSLADGWKVLMDPCYYRTKVQMTFRAKVVCTFAEIIARMSQYESMLLVSYFCGLEYDDIASCSSLSSAKDMTVTLAKIKYVFENVKYDGLSQSKALMFADFAFRNIENEEYMADTLGFTIEQTKALTCFLRMLMPRNSM